MLKDLTTNLFKKNVYDFDKHDSIKPENQRPIILDFYAEWCGPCKVLKPTLEKISNDYEDIDVYTINTDDEYELSKHFKIRSVPTLVFISADGEIKTQVGNTMKTTIERTISEFFHIEKVHA